LNKTLLNNSGFSPEGKIKILNFGTLNGVADFRYESSFMGFLKPRLKLTFGYVQSWNSYLDSATPLMFLVSVD
jgi:hypothetical protein